MALLDGMNQITSHVHRSEAIVLSWIRRDGFHGGIWQSDTDLVAAHKRQFGSDISGALDLPHKREVK